MMIRTVFGFGFVLATLGSAAIVTAQSGPPVLTVPDRPTPPGITRPWPTASAGLGQTIELEGLRITPIRVVRDLRQGCVAPPGELPQRLCVAHGWLDLRLRIAEPRRTRTVTLQEMTTYRLRSGATLGYVARPDRAPGDPAQYSFDFTVWPKGVAGPFDR